MEVSIRPPSWATARTTQDIGVRLQPPSADFTRDRVLLRTGDHFRIGSTSFEFEFYKGEDVQVASSAISDAAVIDLEEGLEPGALQFNEGEPFDSTPSPSKGVDTTIQDTPSMLSRHCDPVEAADHLIGEIAGNAIQGNEDSQHWTPDLGKRDILGSTRGAQRLSLPKSQELDKIPSPLLQPRSAISVWEDTNAAGSPTNDSLPEKNSSADIHRSSPVGSSKRESNDVLLETELGPVDPPNGLHGLDVNNNGTSSPISERSTTRVARDVSRSEPAEQELTEPMSRPNLVQEHTEQLHRLTGATAASSRTSAETPKRLFAQVSNGEEKDSFSDHARSSNVEMLSIEASTDAVSLPKVDTLLESNISGSPPLPTMSVDGSHQPAKDVIALSMLRDVDERRQTPPNHVIIDKLAPPTFEHIHSSGAVIDDACATEEDAQALASGAEDTQESTRQRSDYLLMVAIDSQQPTSSQIDALLTSDVDVPRPHQDDMHNPIVPMMEASPGKGDVLRHRNSKRKRSDGHMSDAITPVKAVKVREIHDLSNSQDSNGSTIVVQMSAVRNARARESAKIRSRSEHAEASSSAKTRASVGSSQSSSAETKPKILFASSTNVDTQQRYMSFLRRNGAIKVDTVQRCNLLCVGKGKELKKTSKLIQAIASGIDVVTDEWIFQSFRDGRLLDPLAFCAEDPEREAEWGVTLTKAIERGKQGRKPFDGWTILFTPVLKKELGKGFTELKEIAMHAGAKTVRAAMPQKTSKETTRTLVLTAEDDDVSVLQESGWKCYGKDILTLSVLRGVLDPESDEFLLSVSENS